MSKTTLLQSTLSQFLNVQRLHITQANKLSQSNQVKNITASVNQSYSNKDLWAYISQVTVSSCKKCSPHFIDLKEVSNILSLE